MGYDEVQTLLLDTAFCCGTLAYMSVSEKRIRPITLNGKLLDVLPHQERRVWKERFVFGMRQRAVLDLRSALQPPSGAKQLRTVTKANAIRALNVEHPSWAVGIGCSCSTHPEMSLCYRAGYFHSKITHNQYRNEWEKILTYKLQKHGTLG